MKIVKLFTVTVFCFLLLNFCAFAKTEKSYKIDIPDGFTTAYSDSDKTDISKIVGIKSEEAEKYFTDNNLLFLSVDEKNSFQIKLSETKDNFSAKTVNFSYLSDEKLLSLSENLFAKTDDKASSKVKLVQNGGMKFLKRNEAHKDSGGEYVVTQYVTVVNGKNYRLSVLAPGLSESDVADTIFKSLEIFDEESNVEASLIQKVLIISGIVIFSGVIIVTAITFFKKKKVDI